jgi:hypothetical protein
MKMENPHAARAFRKIANSQAAIIYYAYAKLVA